VDFLSALKDGHANLYDNTGLPIYGYKIPRIEKDIESFDTTLIKKYINKELKQFNEFRYETLPNNIGYIHYIKFTGDRSEYEKFDLILEYLKETKGLIIDIRNNGGGNNASSYYMIKRLISTPFEGVQWTIKGGGFYPIETINPEGDYLYTKPIVVLINGVSFSSAEGFANLCKKIPHITLIGDTTGGGSGVPEIFTLQNSSIKLRIPIRCEMRYDGEHYEWNGIIPDILIPQTKEDIDNNRDIQLEQAIEYINNQ
jgi:C-terminal processing protease CtpA/Prc